MKKYKQYLIAGTIALVGILALLMPVAVSADMWPMECHRTHPAYDKVACERSLSRKHCYLPVNYPTIDDREKCLKDVEKLEKHQEFVQKYGSLDSNLARFFANIGVELAIGSLALMFLEKLRRRSFLSIAIVNAASWPLFYLAVTFIGAKLWFIAVAEILIVAAEAAGIYVLNKKSITKRQALLVSVVCNASTVALSIFLFDLFGDAWKL